MREGWSILWGATKTFGAEGDEGGHNKNAPKAQKIVDLAFKKGGIKNFHFQKIYSNSPHILYDHTLKALQKRKQIFYLGDFLDRFKRSSLKVHAQFVALCQYKT